MPDSDELHPPERLRRLVSWQVSRASTLGARITAQRMPLSSRADFAVLAALQETGPRSQVELGRQLGLDRNDVNAIVTRLGETSLIERQPDPLDRRRNIVTITGAGSDHLDRLQGHADSVQRELLRGLEPAEQRRLRALLAKLLDGHAPQPA